MASTTTTTAKAMPVKRVTFLDSDDDVSNAPNGRFKVFLHSGGRIPLKRGSIDLENLTSNPDLISANIHTRQKRMFKSALKKVAHRGHGSPSPGDPVALADSVGALLVSAQVTPDEKRDADQKHRRLRRRAIWSTQKRNVYGVRVPTGDTESDETGSESYQPCNSGNSHEGIGSPTPGGRKRKRKSVTRPASEGYGSADERGSVVTLVRSSLPPPSKRWMQTTHSQLLPVVDLVKLQPQPIRLQYDPPPRGDRSDAWFIEAFRLLYREAENFVSKYYCVHDLKSHGQFYQPWAIMHTPEFVSWAEQVAEPDPLTGWDSLLRNTEERKWFIMGIIVRVLRIKIFDEELFGINEREQDLMHAIETTFFLSEGFHRTDLRAKVTRSIIGNGSVTGNFYPQVAMLTAQISLMLHPLTEFLYSIPPPLDKPLPMAEDLYQSLHNLVSRAAHLSLCVRLSPTIIHLVDNLPGSVYEPSDAYSLNVESYAASRERIITRYNYARATWQASKDKAKSALESLVAVGPAEQAKAGRDLDAAKANEPTSQPHLINATGNKLSHLQCKGVEPTDSRILAAQNELAYIETHPPTHPDQNYQALTKIAVWPVITRYKPGSAEDDRAVMDDGPLRQSEKDGMRIMQISKSALVNYYGRTDQSDRKSKVRLTSWISHKAEEEERKRKTKKRQWSGKLVRGVFATVVVWGVWFYSGNTISDMVGELGNASSVGA